MKLKLFLSLVLVGLTGITTFSQSGHHCSRVKGHDHNHTRSARLSNHYIDLTEEYNVHFYKLDIELERTSIDISGKVQIHVNVEAPVLDTMLFELWDDFLIDDILMNGITPVSYTREESAVIVPVDFEAGDNFFIEVIYAGTPPSGGGPFGGGGMNNAESPSWGNQITWSLSEPFAAYEWFPCKQSLTDKADSVHVFITTDESNMAGSNGLLTDVVDVGGGKKRYEWKSNYPIDYYLISVAVGEYVEYTIYAEPEGAEPVMIQNFIYNNPACLPFFISDIDETVDYLELYSELYGLYPFHEEKYGHCMAPIGGGMEHQTMTTQGYFVNTLTAHELGHQWFGDNVTCASWSDIWLNEGFASYSEELMLAEFYPGNEVTSMQDRHNNIMGEPGGSVWVEDSLNVSRIFNGRLTYDKGAAILHTLRFLIGDDDLFFQVLQDFQVAFTDSSAHTSDFKALAEDVTGLDFTDYFNEWYYGEGYPTYSLEYTLIDGSIILALDQETSMPGVTPLFTNDLEVKVNGPGGVSEIYRLTDIDAASQTFVFPFPSDNVVAIGIDPNNWIINQNGGISENETLASLVEIEKELKIYPNPTAEFLMVKNTSGNTDYYIVDGAGRTVLRGVLKDGQNQLDVSELSEGIYVLNVLNRQVKFTKN